MLNHHIQKSIVSTLAFAEEGISFSELKPEGLENKLFDYHLKQVIKDGYAQKSDDKLYSLTPEGKRLGRRISESVLAQADKAESVLFLVIRRGTDGAWMMYKRKTHPLINRVGFMHTRPNASETTVETAKKACKQLGIDANFTVAGSGIFRMTADNEIESFTNYTFLKSDDATGEIKQNDPNAHYFWDARPDFGSELMFPNMPLLVERYNSGELFYLEKDLSL